MPQPGMRWRHVIINTKSSWLHGDERGFRSRDHRIHSSGDYRNPPPAEEHRALREYEKVRASERIVIPLELRASVLAAIVGRFRKERFTILAASTGATHVHAPVELPDDMPAIREFMGRCKRAACEAVKHEMPGEMWSAGGEYKAVDTPDHQRRVYAYVYDGQEADAATWSFQDGVFRPPRRPDPGRR